MGITLKRYTVSKHDGTTKIVDAAHPHAAANRAFRLKPGWHYDEHKQYPSDIPAVFVRDTEGRVTRFYYGANG